MQTDRIDTLLLNLNAFSQTGGVEKVSRILAKAFYDLAEEEQKRFYNLSLYDSEPDQRYSPKSHYRGFAGNKLKFILAAVRNGRKAEKLILTHINLAAVALLIKIVNPGIKIFLFAHGIEIWRVLSVWKQRLVHSTYKVIAVSNYTKNRIIALYPGIDKKVTVLNNCLDPFFPVPGNFKKSQDLLDQYKICQSDKVVLTLCRLSSSEMYKGYDKVIRSLKDLDTPAWKYLLMGGYDTKEFKRISTLIKEQGLEDKIVLTGFIPDKDLVDHLLLGDVFIMPSTDEGFGIVFIEASACGQQLIAGNIDGSTDALLQGKLGQLICPTDEKAIKQALNQALHSPENKASLQRECLKNFSYQNFKSKLKHLLSE